MLFKRAESKTDAMLRRLTDARAHLKRRDPDGVLGAIEGLERDLAGIHSLMSLAQELGPTEEVG